MTEEIRELLRRAQEHMANHTTMRIPNFLEEIQLRYDIADALGECVEPLCNAEQVGNHRCAEHGKRRDPEPMMRCSTCMHDDKGMTESPCIDCDDVFSGWEPNPSISQLPEQRVHPLVEGGE